MREERWVEPLEGSRVTPEPLEGAGTVGGGLISEGTGGVDFDTGADQSSEAATPFWEGAELAATEGVASLTGGSSGAEDMGAGEGVRSCAV